MAGSEPRTSPRVGRAVAAAVVLCLIAEIIAQLIVFSFSQERFRSLSLYKWSAYGLVRNNPELNSPAFKINAQGFRSTGNFVKEKPAGTFRVLLLGGSVLYSGTGGPAVLEKYGRVHSDQTIANYLEAEMAKDPAFAGRKIEVINGAINFNRITEISTAFLADYMFWNPDFVVVFGAVNNFSTPRKSGDFAKGITDLQRPHPWHAEFARLTQDNGLPSTIERLWRTGGEHSAALALSTKVAVVLADRLVAITSKLAPLAIATTVPLETSAERVQYFELFATYAEAMIAAAQQRGSGIGFVWEPMLSDLGGIKPLSAEEKSIFPAVQRAPSHIAQYDETRLLFVDHFQRRNLPVFDPTNDLRKWDRTVYIDYGHYTPGGNQFIAERLYASMGDAIRANANANK